MDCPPPPQDQNLRNIIDKLAEFVARNGPEFEQMTKNKQQANPKFAFLFGGEFYSYYQWRKEKEKERFGYSNSNSNSQVNPVWQSPIVNKSTMNAAPPQPNPNAKQIEALNLQQNTLKDQILQSEQNLQAQHTVLLQQQQKQVDQAVKVAQNELLQRQADEAEIKLPEFDTILQPIIESCTKDSISNGKSWILQRTSDASKCHVVSQVMVEGAPFAQKLHLIYLVNDVIHHCVRKNSEELKKCLENVVIPMFCNAQMCANEEQRAKLTKLLTLWESKANFFDACVISKLKSPPSSLQEYQASLLTLHATVITPLTQASKNTYENYQQQHQIFVEHATRQVALLETQKQQLEQQGIKMLMQQQPQQASSISGPNSINPQLQSIIQQLQSQINNGNSSQPPASNSPRNIPTIINSATSDEKSFKNSNNGNHQQSPQEQQQSQQQSQPEPQNFPSINEEIYNNSRPESPRGQQLNYYSQPPPPIPDMSKPPPGFNPPVANETPNIEDLVPKLPYFDLPAGLMVPLISLEDYSYKSLDSSLIRLPAPTAPSERLLAAVEAFYALPSHERPRDGEGWEKLGLYEYFKVKNSAKKQKQEELMEGKREKSRSPTPIDQNMLKPPRKKNKRVYRSRSRTRSRSRSKTKSKSRSRSRSPSPRKNRREIRRSRSISPQPPRRENKNIRERERSASPPIASFAGATYTKSASDFIEESNKGHQMLMKMGWGGTGKGLGAASQGIDQPISAGEVRERQDLYKGIGAPTASDPYESFRRNKANSFIHRIRSRDERS